MRLAEGFEVLAQHPMEIGSSAGIAIVQGAGRDDGFGRAIIRSLRKQHFGGKVVPVNPAGAPRLGLPACRSVHELPAAVEGAIIEVSRERLDSVLRECLDREIRVLAIVLSPDAPPVSFHNQLEGVRSDQDDGDRSFGPHPRASRPCSLWGRSAN